MLCVCTLQRIASLNVRCTDNFEDDKEHIILYIDSNVIFYRCVHWDRHGIARRYCWCWRTCAWWPLPQSEPLVYSWDPHQHSCRPCQSSLWLQGMEAMPVYDFEVWRAYQSMTSKYAMHFSLNLWLWDMETMPVSLWVQWTKTCKSNLTLSQHYFFSEANFLTTSSCFAHCNTNIVVSQNTSRLA